MLAELDNMPARFDQQLGSMQASLNDMAKIPIPPPSVPQLDEPEPPEPTVELLSGSDLREFLLLSTMPKPPGPFRKKLGNIWEDWQHYPQTGLPADGGEAFDPLEEGE